IAADYRQGYVEFLFLILHPIWTRIYAGIEVDAAGLDRVKEAAKQAPIVLVPSHKSHMDYLIISYVFYLNGLIPPHIAAGDNLNFWPMGHIFRHSGAFFLRRRFAGLELYTLVFRHYLRKMIKEGFAIEFFIEGGRSRSGKILPPKFGMLRFLVEAVLSGASRDIYFVPVNIGYEKIVEERSLMRELQGGEKEQENLGDLFKTTRILNRKFGRLYAQFDEPISLREFFAGFGVDDEHPDDETLQVAVTRLGHELVHCLSRISTATPSGVVALSLLSLGKRGVSRDELLCRIGFVVGLLHARDARLSNSLRVPLQEAAAELGRSRSPSCGDFSQYAPIGALFEDVVDEVLHLFSNNRFVSTYQDEEETLFRVEDGARITLDYYKNQVIEFFVDEAIVATAFLISETNGGASLEMVRHESLELSKLLKFEFHFATNTDFPTAFARTIEHLTTHEILALQTDTLVVAGNASFGLPLFRNLIRGFIESYYVAALTAQRFLAEPMTEGDFLARCQR
ncbi:MAG: 1-acyl-sn-glycerol-3-phosphate acyltransferase, partial [Myxococcales bacterium]|nr:1-acyl-sn-glycerol-3-phosphate acyltransferase [Myxococcales bacterium]